MKNSENIRLRCLELAINTPDRQGTDIDPFKLARKYYAFVKEKDGSNVIATAPFLSEIKKPSKIVRP